MSIAANLKAVQQRMSRAAQRAQRDPTEITLVGVSKTQPLADVVEAYQAGLRHFGENRADESTAKIEAFEEWRQSQPHIPEAAQWHFIGHIQSRQAGEVLAGQPALIHSVDSVKLAKRLDRLARRDDLPPQAVLIQCNVSGEESKFGFELSQWSTEPAQLETFLAQVDQIAGLEKLHIRGLMTMAPWYDDPEATRPTFKNLAALRQQLRTARPRLTWQHLSMGMTDDFEVAIEEGATIIRVGRAIFGERNDT